MNFNDIIISSRIRLARNLYKTPFPTNKGEKEGARVLDLVTGALHKAGNFEFFRIKNLDEVEKLVFKEKHLISKELIDNYEHGGLALSADRTISVMINEEDHIRAQCIQEGFSLNLAYNNLNKVDDVLMKNLELSFDYSLGFLTSCPTNLGTGMRASIMMFLPALTLNGKINNLIETVAKLGITIRGVYGEGSVAEGYMYQLSNQMTLGLTEEEIINNVNSTVLKIKELEVKERLSLKENKFEELQDFVFRAYGVLSNCYKINSSEFMKLLAQVKLGVSLNVINLKNESLLDSLLELAKPASLVQLSGRELDASERDLFRAEYLHNALKNERN